VGCTSDARAPTRHRATDAVRVVRRNGFARPWPEGQPRQKGERCDLSDLLVDQCSCRIHAKKEDSDGTATEQELDFRE
jgi:hypothetical protein